MSINSTLSSVSKSSSTSQVSKSSGSESTKKTSESSFKDEMNKVTTSEKDSAKETKEVKETTAKDEAGKVKEESAAKGTEDKKSEVSVDDKNITKDNKNETLQAGIKENILKKDAELKNLEMLKNQQLLDRKNLQLAGDKQQAEILDSQQILMQQGILSEKELNINIKNNKTQEKHLQNLKNKDDNEITELELNAAQNIAMQQQNIEVQNNYNVDTHKAEETEMLRSNIIFNNTLSNFDANNIELSNDIQQMINISSLGANSNVNAAQSVGTMSFNNSSNKISMTQSDAEFFVNLTQNNENVTVQNITAQAAEMTREGAEVKEVEKNVEVSQTLLNALSESREKNQPLRIDFDQNVSVILRVSKDGVIAANFLPHDKAVEQYLKNNIEALKNTFNENDLPYSDLSYSNRGGKQQKEQQRNRQQQQQ